MAAETISEAELTPAERRRRKVRDSIIDAAEAIFAEEGEAGLSMRRIAERICDNGPLAVKAVTRSLREHQECMAEDDAMLASDELANPVFASADAKEGMRAFKEKRKAVFKGE